MARVYLLRAIIFATSFFFGCGAYAQAIGPNTFLKGRYEEVGIGNLGYYGTDSIPPVGYHPHPAGSRLGFVADPQMTGWDTASAGPHYWGDYFVPGTPYEGWELQVDGMRCLAFNKGAASTFTYDGGMPSCTGGNIGYTIVGSKVVATWQGSIDSVTLTQITTIDTNDVYFTVQVILTNTAVAPKNNLYYLRTVDPDNDETWGGSFTTQNVIQCQATDSTVVSATGLSSAMSYMALGTADTAATAVIYTTWPVDSTLDLATIYNQTGSASLGAAYYAAGSTVTNDIAIGLVISVPHLATVDSAADSVARITSAAALHPANTASFTLFYSFSPQATTSAIANTRAVTDTGSLGTIKNASVPDAVRVYPNPSTDRINITGLNIADNIILYDMMGRQVQRNWTAVKQGVNTFSYNGLPGGGYLLVITDSNGNIKARIPVRKQ